MLHPRGPTVVATINGTTTSAAPPPPPTNTPQVTRRFKRTVVATVPECVHAHNEWVPSAVKPGSTPFGKAAESNAGCTMKPEDDLHFEKVVVAEAAEAAAEEAEVEPKEPHSIIKCSRCGMEGHFSLKCPLRDVVSVPPGGPTGPPVDVPDKEVPEGEKRRLYVTNIAPGVEEEEVRAIFVPYGRGFKCYLKEPKHASDVYTATVTFSTHEEAKRAMEELNGCGFRSMRLHIEWKKEKKDGGGGGRRRRRPCQQPLRVRLRQGAAAKPRHRPQVASPGGHRGDRRGGGDEGPLRGCDALPCDPSRRRT